MQIRIVIIIVDVFMRVIMFHLMKLFAKNPKIIEDMGIVMSIARILSLKTLVCNTKSIYYKDVVYEAGDKNDDPDDSLKLEDI